ncbi:MAG: hypothetical protein KVP17_004671 [Porospora cf. gigantea B]|nr:MAG: hypothetical protein KVP17_004671 [Porospora cf. gigantea B]
MHSEVHLLRDLVARTMELGEKPTTVSRLLAAQNAKAQLPESFMKPCQDCVHPFPHCSAVLVPFPFDQCSSVSDGLPRVMLFIGGRGDRSESNRLLAISELSGDPT